jgi:hypothetical protein
MGQSTAPNCLQACAIMLVTVKITVTCMASWSDAEAFTCTDNAHAQAGCRAQSATGSEQCYRQVESGAEPVCTCAEEALPVLLARGRGCPLAGGTAPPAASAPPVGLHLLGAGLHHVLSVADGDQSGGQNTMSLSSRTVLASSPSHVHVCTGLLAMSTPCRAPADPSAPPAAGRASGRWHPQSAPPSE